MSERQGTPQYEVETRGERTFVDINTQEGWETFVSNLDKLKKEPGNPKTLVLRIGAGIMTSHNIPNVETLRELGYNEIVVSFNNVPGSNTLDITASMGSVRNRLLPILSPPTQSIIIDKKNYVLLEKEAQTIQGMKDVFHLEVKNGHVIQLLCNDAQVDVTSLSCLGNLMAPNAERITGLRSCPSLEYLSANKIKAISGMPGISSCSRLTTFSNQEGTFSLADFPLSLWCVHVFRLRFGEKTEFGNIEYLDEDKRNLVYHKGYVVQKEEIEKEEKLKEKLEEHRKNLTEEERKILESIHEYGCALFAHFPKSPRIIADGFQVIANGKTSSPQYKELIGGKVMALASDYFEINEKEISFQTTSEFLAFTSILSPEATSTDL